MRQVARNVHREVVSLSSGVEPSGNPHELPKFMKLCIRNVPYVYDPPTLNRGRIAGNSENVSCITLAEKKS